MVKKFLASTALTAFPVAFDNTLSDVIRAMDADEMTKRAKDSAAMLPYWDKIDAIMGGIETMRNASDLYLPKFPDEEQSEYKTRLANTKFTNVFRDIVEALASKPFEEEISLTKTEKDTQPPKPITDFVEDVDGTGNNLTMFAAQTFFNGIANAIDWIFVDYPERNPNVRTIADAQRAGMRPFWSRVLARNVLEVRSRVIGGKETLTYMRILEPGEPDHVRIFQRSDTGLVTWELWVKSDKPAPSGKTQFILEKEGTISIGVIPLVPFMTGRREGRSFVFFPAMQDAADLQIELYQQESGLKFIKTIAAYPMLGANGMRPQMEADGKTPKKIKIGPMRVLWGLPDNSGNHGEWKYIEPGANSMKFLAEDIKSTIQELRELGRQPLTAQTGNLTVITTAVAAGKSKSAVAAWANALKNALENALVLTRMFMAVNYDPQVTVYDEFDEVTDDNKDLEHLRAMRAKGDLSQETYWKETKRRGVLSAEFDAENERALLLSETPSDPLEDENDDPASVAG